MEGSREKRKECRESGMCRWLGYEDCMGCYLNSFKGDDIEAAIKNWDVLQSLLPDDIDALSGDECQFCRESPKERAYFAITDLAHKEPESKKGMFFGLGKKVRNPIGSLIQVSIACCKDCRRDFIMYDLLKWVCVVGMVAVAVILLAIPATAAFFASIGEFAPFLVLLAGVLIGFLLAMLLSNAHLKRMQKRVRTNIFEIPLVHKMRAMGWFLPQEGQNAEISRLLFSKKRAGFARSLKYKPQEGAGAGKSEAGAGESEAGA